MTSIKALRTTIYSRTGCPYCTKLKELYEAQGWHYTEYSLNTHFTRDQFYAEFGRNATFPQVIINNSKIGGCSETITYLKENKHL